MEVEVEGAERTQNLLPAWTTSRTFSSLPVAAQQEGDEAAAQEEGVESTHAWN